MDEKALKIGKDLLEFTKARSVFLYGSRAMADFYGESDYEIGVLMDRDKYLGRSEIRKTFNIPGVNIFPFYLDNFIQNNPDTPFVKSIYIREIILAGKTITGENIIENLKAPEIKVLDVIEDLRFNLGYSLAATHSYRNGDNETASLHLAKSCLFGTRDLIILKLQQFPVSYNEILEASKKIDLQVYSELPEYCYKLRKREVEIDDKNLFKNISYLNQFIENQLLEFYEKNGNVVLIS